MPDSRRLEPIPAADGSEPILLSRTLAALPLEGPAIDPWPSLAERLADARRASQRKPTWPTWLLAVAAALVVVAILPWPAALDPTDAGTASTTEQRSTDIVITALMAESARLEQRLRDAQGWPQPAALATLSLDIEDRLRLIDADLGLADNRPEQLITLWTDRVALLRQLDRLEQTRNRLAADGQAFDATLVVAY